MMAAFENDPDIKLLETGEWCQYARRYECLSYGHIFWLCESPTKKARLCKNYTCALDGKDTWRCTPRPLPLPAEPGTKGIFA